MEREDIIYKELSYAVWGAELDVRNNFGSGHKESVYQEAYEDELDARGVKFMRETAIRIYTPKNGKPLKSFYKPDFIVDEKIIVEIKAVENIHPNHEVQVVNYLTATGIDEGLLLNFGGHSLEFRKKFRRRKRHAKDPF